MNIAEMHVWFRQYAQQMGMQNVRAILPEQIDVLINTSILDTVNQLVRENVGLTNDRVVTDNVKIGQINALRTIYKVDEVPLTVGTNIATKIPRIGNYLITGFLDDVYENDVEHTLPKHALYLVDLAINYKVNTEPTGYFPIRIVDNAYLADTIQDYVLKPRVRTPVGVINGNNLELYFGEDWESGNGLMSTNSLSFNDLRISYIKIPNKVKYISDISNENNVNCDLPESLHADIVKHAVDLYNVSVSGSLYSSQQNQQAQQREAVRNEGRPTNDGYQN